MTSDRNPRSHVGVVTDDPLRALPIGAQLRLKTGLVPAKPTEGLTTVADWGSFEGCLLMVYFGKDGVDQIVGTAVLVGPGVALAAAHIFEDWLDELMAGRAGCMLTGFTNRDQVFWRPVHFVMPPNSDLVIISMTCASDLPEGNQLTFAHISTRTPRAGELVMLCGFRGGQESFVHVGNKIELTATGYISSGRVTQVFPARRDRAMYRWPCYEVDCVSVGGMSGGPVFDAAGYLVGLVGGGWDLDDGNGRRSGSPSYVWLIWPCLAYSFKSEWPPGLHAAPITLIGAPPGFCMIERPGAVRSDSLFKNGERGILYESWSER